MSFLSNCLKICWICQTRDSLLAGKDSHLGQARKKSDSRGHLACFPSTSRITSPTRQPALKASRTTTRLTVTWLCTRLMPGGWGWKKTQEIFQTIYEINIYEISMRYIWFNKRMRLNNLDKHVKQIWNVINYILYIYISIYDNGRLR